jgi:Leucine-rich repeat (LRR) protein
MRLQENQTSSYSLDYSRVAGPKHVCGFNRAQDVTIPDAGSNAAIRAAFAKPISPLTVQDVLSLTNLDASNRSISNLTGLEFATNLLSLNLQGNLLRNPRSRESTTRWVCGPLIYFVGDEQGLTELCAVFLKGV